MPKEKEAKFFRENRWVLFDRGNGTIGVAPENAARGKNALMTIQGSLERATEAAATLESDGFVEQTFFDLGLLENPEDR